MMFKAAAKHSRRSLAREFSSATAGSRLKTIGISSGLTVLLGTFGYLALNTKEPTVKQSLPAVASKVPMDLVQKIVTHNETSKNLPGKHFVRLDLNSVASNQPCEDYHSEHSFNNGYILGIYDGHGGPECGALVSEYLASYVADRIKQAPATGKSDKDHIKQALQTAFVNIDDDILNGCLQKHPITLTRSWWNPFTTYSSDYSSIIENLKCATSGACALVAYVHENDVYVASAGDCRAVLGRKRNFVKDGKNMYEAIDLSVDHTPANTMEVGRLLQEHPGEEETIIFRGRVLGGLMPTRAMGDARYKWSRRIQEQIVPHVYPDGRRKIPSRLITPPYVTALPEVVHYERDDLDTFLVLACDGLWDQMSSSQSVDLVGSLIDEKFEGNYATALFKAALSEYKKGGPIEDWERIQHHLSIPAPLCRRHRDDITVNVLFFKDVEAKGNEVEAVSTPPAVSEPQLQNWISFLKFRPRL